MHRKVAGNSSSSYSSRIRSPILAGIGSGLLC